MSDTFRKQSRFGSTDWAAQQFLRMLDQEDREKAELRHLQTTGWLQQTSRQPAGRRDGPVFTDGRAALVDLVESNSDRQQALQEEARRRAQMPVAQVSQRTSVDPRSQVAQSPTRAPADQAPLLVIPKRPLPMPERLGRQF